MPGGPNTRCAAEYQNKLSGPLLDRIDLNIEVPAVTAADLILPPPSEGSREVAARVAQARAVQAERYAALGLAGITTNAAAPSEIDDELAAVTVPSARQEKYGDRRASPGGKIMGDVWEVPRVCGTFKERVKGVPTQLPSELVRRISGNFVARA